MDRYYGFIKPTTFHSFLIFFTFHSFFILRACSLVVSDLRSETKASRFEAGCKISAEVTSLQQSPGLCLSL